VTHRVQFASRARPQVHVDTRVRASRVRLWRSFAIEECSSSPVSTCLFCSTCAMCSTWAWTELTEVSQEYFHSANTQKEILRLPLDERKTQYYAPLLKELAERFVSTGNWKRQIERVFPTFRSPSRALFKSCIRRRSRLLIFSRNDCNCKFTKELTNSFLNIYFTFIAILFTIAIRAL
jgi:hypothetical protein